MFKKRKGIILAGGSGTRLYPSTLTISKQLLPIFDKPMIYYPLTTLMLANIKDILIISTPHDIPLFKNLLNDGSQWGINIEYVIQEKPEGLAQALIIAEDYLQGSPSILILGDNIFHGHIFNENINHFLGAKIFLYKVSDPHRYGVATIRKDKITSIVEKPKNTKSNLVVTGLYFYDNDIIEIAKNIKPSKRNELEITDVNKYYLRNKRLRFTILSKESIWFDAGTSNSLLEASNYIHAIIKFNNGLTKILIHDTNMTIPIFNSLYPDHQKEIPSNNLDFSIINNLEFQKINLKKFPVVRILDLLPKKHSLFETVIVSANDTLVNMFLEKKIEFLDISKNLLKITSHKEFIKYKHITPKNAADIKKLSNYVSLKINPLSI